jgi:hypothetical protein
LIYGAGPIGRGLALRPLRQIKELFEKAEIVFGLHAKAVGSELLELAEELATLQAEDGTEVPDPDAPLACVPRPPGAPKTPTARRSNAAARTSS